MELTTTTDSRRTSWHPRSFAGRQAAREKAQTRAGTRREQRAAERRALWDAELQRLATPEMVAHRADLLAASAAVASQLGRPVRS